MTQAGTNAARPRGLCTVSYMADDFEGAKRWYAQVTGVEPYLDKSGYAEFRLGDYMHELGIVDAAFADHVGGRAPSPSGALVYWHVDDVEAALARLKEMGATEHHPLREFGEGFVAAAVVDPFGNVFGIMHNPHYLAVLEDGPREGGR